MDDLPSVAALMRQWRHAARINTAEAGRRLGMSGRNIEDIEQGRRRAGDVLTRVALITLIEAAEAEPPRQKQKLRSPEAAA